MAAHKVVFDSDELGQIIRRSRKAQGLTLVDAAGLCGVSVRFLSELENGRDSCGIGRILLVAQSLGLDLCLQSRNGELPSG
ncbi:MAG: helix-turn-helix domain-containing protein [Granulosicoccaceae bacterium]